jgi:hypothetical protein
MRVATPPKEKEWVAEQMLKKIWIFEGDRK